MKLVIAGAGALLLKLLLAAFTAGTNDVTTWEHDVSTLHDAGFADLYRSGVTYRSPEGLTLPRQAFIHPPAVLHGLRILGSLQDTTRVPLRFWLRAGGAFADLGTLILLWRMTDHRVPLLLALSPLSILISGFHGNTDPIMMFFVVSAVFLAGRANSGLAGAAASGAAFGLACSVKLIPVIFAPAILLSFRGFRPRLQWIVAAAIVWFGLSMPYLAREPVLIVRGMLGYGSASGLWGFSLISALFGAGHIYNPAAKWIAIFAASSLPLWCKRDLVTECGLIAFTFLLLSPGFGLQYLAWAIPWTVALDRRLVFAYHGVGGGFALVVYAAAAKVTAAGMYADLLNSRHFGILALTGLVCWITIAAITWRWFGYKSEDRETLVAA